MEMLIVLFMMAITAPSFANKSAPVLLWKSTTSDTALPDLQERSSTGEKSQLHVFLNSVDTEAMILFLMNELNIEDFSGYPSALPLLEREFESCPHVFSPSMPSVQVEQLTSYRLLTVNVSDLSSVRLADGSSRTLLLVPLQDRAAADRRTALQQVDTAIGQVLERVKLLTGRYVAVLTGRYTGMGGEINIKPSRSLKTVSPSKPTSQQRLFLNFGCVLLYTSDCPVIHFQSVKETASQQALLLPLGAPSSNTSSCNGSDVNTVTVIWQHTNGTDVDLASVTLKLSFKAKMTRPGGSDLSSWTLENATLSYAGTVDGKAIGKAVVALDFGDVYAPRHFSYHCTDRLWAAEPSANGTDSDAPTLTAIRLPGFQVQAFLPSGAAAARFGRAWDCTTMFTIPILSGLFVSLLLLIILAFSLVMLANVPSVSRFDDPHGKLLLQHLPSAE